MPTEGILMFLEIFVREPVSCRRTVELCYTTYISKYSRMQFTFQNIVLELNLPICTAATTYTNCHSSILNLMWASKFPFSITNFDFTVVHCSYWTKNNIEQLNNNTPTNMNQIAILALKYMMAEHIILFIRYGKHADSNILKMRKPKRRHLEIISL